MRIAHVTTWYVPGHVYQENKLPYHQQELGNDVCVIASDRPFPNLIEPPLFRPGKTQDRGILLIRLGTRFGIERRGQLMLAGLGAAILDWRPDIVHVHGTWTFPTMQTIFLRRRPFRIFVDDHADNANIRLARLDRRLWIRFFRYVLAPVALRRVRKFISVNPFSRWHLENNLGIPANRIADLPLGIDAEAYRPDVEARKATRSRLGLAGEDLVFYTAGKFDGTKQLELLIDAFGQVAATDPRARLLLIGSGPAPYVESLRRRAADTRSAERIKFAGWVSGQDLPFFYNAGDVAVMPGKISTVKDAIAVGAPLITTNELACGFLIANDNGCAFPAGDVQELAKAMTRYLCAPELIEAHGQRSLELVRDALSWAQVAKRSLDIYDSG